MKMKTFTYVLKLTS